MEETQRVVTNNFLKFGCQLKKKEEELKLVKDRIKVLLAKEKAREAKIACLSKKAQVEQTKLREELAKFQSYDPNLVDALWWRNQEYQNQLDFAEQGMQQKGEFECQRIQFKQEMQQKNADFEN